jgi:polysaccharide deacetylase 2 family uncharacterized protein YibQ
MAKRKSTRKKRRPKKSRKPSLFKSSFFKALAATAILGALVVTVGFLIYQLAPPHPSTPSPDVKSVKAPKPVLKKKPAFEIYPQEKPAPRQPLARKDIPTAIPKPVPRKKMPAVALIIDDLGYDKKIAKKFAQLDVTLTFSILPHSPFQQRIAKLARSKGLEVMIHMPMEPVEYPQVDPGPGTLLTSMSPDELIAQLDDNLNSLPDVKGINNHMGSRITAESSQMYQIFSVLKKRGLFFIDSRTTAESLGEPSARLFKVPFAQRDVFIDHHLKADFIRRQINELIRVAKKNGTAVGILHPHLTTFEVLQDMLPDLQSQVQLVPASKVVHPIG